MVFKRFREFLSPAKEKLSGLSLKKIQKRLVGARKGFEEAMGGAEPPPRAEEVKCGPLVDKFKDCTKFVRAIMLEKAELDVLSDIARTTTSGVKGSAVIAAKKWDPKYNQETENEAKMAADIMVQKGLLTRRRTNKPDKDLYTMTEKAYCARAVFPTHEGKCICGEGQQQ